MKTLLVRCVLVYIAFFARIAVWRSHATIIGITGSIGKTSTRDAVCAVLHKKLKTYTIRKGNSETGLPLGLLGLTVSSIGFDSLTKSVFDWARLLVSVPLQTGFSKTYDVIIAEMGVDSPDSPKNMSYLLSIVQPHISIITNVSGVHGENYEHMLAKPTKDAVLKAIAHEKCKIVTQNPTCTLAIYNHDSPELQHEIQHELKHELHNIEFSKRTFGLSDQASIYLSHYAVSEEGTEFHLATDHNEKISLSMKGYVLPRGYHEVFAPAILVGLHMNLSLHDIKHALESDYSLEPGRCTILEGIDDSIIIDSTYNASPQAMLEMIAMAKTLSDTSHRPLIFVCGDMRELGKQSSSEHKRVYEACLEGINGVFTVGPLSQKYIAEPLMHSSNISTTACANPHEAGKALKKTLPKRALVLFKGSQNTIFLEEAIKYILAQPSDITQLARQEPYWLEKKQSLART